MLLRVRMKKVEDKLNTTKLEPCDDPAPLKDHYINTEFLTSLPFGTEELTCTCPTSRSLRARSP